MSKLGKIERRILEEVAGICDEPSGAFNFRINGELAGRRTTKNIEVLSKTDKSGLDIHIQPGISGESVHIPVVISMSGLKEAVYNDFYIGDGAEVTIIAGCGIYNCGGFDSVHDGIHRFFVGKGAKVKYIEKHYGYGPGKGGKILNPTTIVYANKDSYVEMELEQIKGVDSTIRKTRAVLSDNAKLVVNERILTHNFQNAKSKFRISLNGADASADIVSRAVARDCSSQTFEMKLVGKNVCKGHAECDAIIMDKAKVLALPALDARNLNAELIHEAAIGKIAGEQLIKLMSLGLTEKEAESEIINGFLK